MPEAETAQETTPEIPPEQLAIEIDSEETPTPVETSSPEEKKTEADEKEDEGLTEYSASVKKRIGKMTARLRESERREQAATEYARAVNIELDQIKKKTANLDQSFVNEFDNRVQTQEQLLKGELKKAIDVGDSEKQAEIQVKLSSVAADKDKVDRVKRQREAAPQQNFLQPQHIAQPQQQQQQPPPQQQTDPRAKKWAEEREWFGEDRPMTLLALAEHESLLTEGYDPDNDHETYYAELDKRITEAFPHKFQKDKRRKSPKVASASRSRVNKDGKKEVVLTESEAKMAKKLNVPLKDYAEQLLRIRERNE